MLYILTLTWNGLDKLKKLKDGLYNNLDNIGIEYKWLIRDNGSKDNTVEEVSAWKNVQVLSVDHNRANFSQGVNSLFDLINGNENDIVLLLNNDIEFGDDVSLSKMIELINRHEVAMVGCRLLYPNSNKLQHSGVAYSKRFNNMPYHYRHKQESDINAEQNRYFQSVTAACCLIEYNDFQRLDENYHWSFEDIDLCLSILSKGFKIAYCGETKIYHHESASLVKNPINKLFLSHNVKYFQSKWFGKYEIDYEKYENDPKYNLIK